MNIYGIRTGVKMTKLVVGDADSIIAQINQEDALHEKVRKVSKNLVEMNAKLVYPLTAVIESTAFIQRVLDNGPAAYQIAEEFKNSPGQIIEVSNQIYDLAVNKYFGPKISKKDTLFDCIVAAAAETLKADAIFSFDSFYKKNGFMLAEDL